MKKQTLRVRNTKINITSLKEALNKSPEVSAAYLFGSAASGQRRVNDLDILVLLHRKVDTHEAYIKLTYKLSQIMKISEDCIDLLFFDLEETDPTVLTRGVNRGILLKNDDPDYLSNTIDTVSRYLLSNEAMMLRGRHLRKERMETFSET